MASVSVASGSGQMEGIPTAVGARRLRLVVTPHLGGNQLQHAPPAHDASSPPAQYMPLVAAPPQQQERSAPS